MTHEPTQFIITNGPGKLNLAIGLVYGTAPEQIPVSFDTTVKTSNSTGSTKLQVRILSLEREDGGGEKYNFTGGARFDISRCLVKGFYDAQKRTGFAQVTSW